MEIHTDIPLSNLTTMRLGGPAKFMADAHTEQELADLIMRAKQENLPVFILGGGSNTIARDEGYQGLVVRNFIKGIEPVSESGGDAIFKIGAGEVWDDFVKFSVERSLSGIEALSGIPGTVGAAPVQNIGAYGQEVADTIISVSVFDTKFGLYKVLENLDCDFGYRNSIFRDSQAGRYAITYVTFRLYKAAPQPPFYQAVQTYLDERNITLFTPQTIREAVLAIRTDKLPDPKQRPNSGSFFKNAVVDKWKYDGLIEQYPEMPSYEMSEGRRKIPTGWLIEQTGLKGELINGIRVHDKNALVLINEAATSYKDLSAAREVIKSAVRDQFGIEIEQEPLEL